MAKQQDKPDEVLTMSRMRRMLLKHSAEERLRIVTWLDAVARRPEDVLPPGPVDARQMSLVS